MADSDRSPPWSYADQLDINLIKKRPVLDRLAANALKGVRRWLPDDESAPVLEIGPGDGRFLHALLSHGFENASAIEADEALAARAAQAGLPVAHCPIDDTIDFLRARPGEFQAIYCAHVLEHVEVKRQIDFVAAVTHALRPGGRFICEVPSATSPLATHSRYIDWTHNCLFTVPSLTFVLSAGGLHDVEILPAPPPPVTPRRFRLDIPALMLQRALTAMFHGVYRLQLVAELGAEGMRQPVTPAILGSGRKL